MAEPTAVAYMNELLDLGVITQGEYDRLRSDPTILSSQDVFVRLSPEQRGEIEQATMSAGPQTPVAPPPQPTDTGFLDQLVEGVKELYTADEGIEGVRPTRNPLDPRNRQAGKELIGGFRDFVGDITTGGGDEQDSDSDGVPDSEDESGDKTAEEQEFEFKQLRQVNIPTYVWDYLQYGDLDLELFYDVAVGTLPSELLPQGWVANPIVPEGFTSEGIIAPEGLSEEEKVSQWKQTQVQNWLNSAGQDDPAAVEAIRAYGNHTDTYIPDMTDDGMKVRDIQAAANAYGMTYREAKHYGSVGRLAGLEINESVALANFLDRAEIMRPEGQTAPKVGGVTDKEYEEAWYPPGSQAASPPSSAEIGEAFREKGRRGKRPSLDEPGVTEWDRFNYYHSFGDAATRFSTAKDKFSNSTVSLLWVVNEHLAERLYSNPYSFNADELGKLVELVGGWDAFESLDPAAANWVAKRLEGGRDVVQVDMDGAREAARTLASAWNMPEMPDSFIEQVAQGVAQPQLAAYRAMQGNPFNPVLSRDPALINTPSSMSLAAKLLRETDLYKELFENSVWGESEEQYAGRFSDQTQYLLGNAGTPATARAGMRTGSVDTVGQQAVFSGEGYKSSTFQKRLAQLREALAEET